MKRFVHFILMAALVLLGLACEQGLEQDTSQEMAQTAEEAATPADAPIGDEVFKMVDQMPEFPGCEDVTDAVEHKQCVDRKLLEFVYGNIEYPKEAKDAGIEGMVVVRFVVNKDGSISDVEVVRDIGGGCGDEVVRVVKQMPRWIPGRQAGQPVRVQYMLPVKFTLKKEEGAQ